MRTYVPKAFEKKPYRYRELQAFCLQYNQYKEEATDIRLQYRATGSGGSGGGEQVSDTESKAERLLAITKKIDVIERTAADVCRNKPQMFNPLLKAVTTRTPLYMINTEAAEITLKRYRQTFFALLDERI